MPKNINKNESGLASIVIAVLIIIIISTLVLGFLQIIRREQRKSLDRQLSSQAFYAAESGVNDAAKAISQQNYSADKTACAPLSSGPAAITGASSNILSATNNVRYTCLLINQKPGSLTYKSIKTDRSTSFPIVASDGAAITGVTLNWRDTTAGFASFRGPVDNKFTPKAVWGSVGILRVDIVPTGNLNHNSLLAGGRTYYLYPNAGSGVAGTVDMNAEPSGAIVNGQCNAAAGCAVKIVNVPGGTYYVRVLSMYKPVSLIVTATDATNAAKNLVGAQTLVDATGKAADVARRIQVTIPRENSDLPDYVVATMDSLCKKFLALPSGVVNDGGGDAACNVVQP